MKHIVLAGGGHANMLALLRLTHTGPVTLVSDANDTPYSGMLPGYIAGLYQRRQCFIDLLHTAAKTNTGFIRARARGISGNTLFLDNNESVTFDVLSINTGAAPPFENTDENACAIKPITKFMNWLEQQDNTPFAQLAVVGGGAGGVETALALAHRWRDKTPRPALSLITRRLLPECTAAMRRYVQQRLQRCEIQLILASANAYDDGILQLADGQRLPMARVIYATPVAAAAWLRRTGLPADNAGFIKINRHLQSPAAAHIFISGDAAAHTPPLPKAGVMAVRQSKILAHNLQVAAGGRAGQLKHFHHSARALYIIGDGSGRGAVASRNGLTISGRWVWHWKQYLDFKFMSKFL